jgi:pilus assembly protein CpaE
MRPEPLTVSVLYGTKDPEPAVPAALASRPDVRVLVQSHDPRELLGKHRSLRPDLLIVDLQAEGSLPPWLEALTKNLQHTTVLVCSRRKEPEFLIRVMQLGVREFLSLPLVPADLEMALERVRTAKGERDASDFSLGRLVAVTGLKGGMGATAVAVNLAVALAETHSDKVALVDLGRPFSDVSKFLDQEKGHSLLDLAQHKDQLDPAFVLKTLQYHEAKVAVLHGCPELQEMRYIDAKLMQKVWGILRTSFDWIVVDLGHWLDDLYLNTVMEADQVLLLTELTIPELANFKKLWSLLEHQGLKTDKVKVVVNRFHKSNGLGLADLEAIQHQPVFFTLPSDYPSLSDSINYGTPLTLAAPGSKLWRSLRCLGDKLMAQSQLAPVVAGVERRKAKKRFLFF